MLIVMASRGEVVGDEWSKATLTDVEALIKI